MPDKIKLYGFNNLTKSLSFNIYDVCYAKTEPEQRKYIDYIDEQYNSKRLTEILCNVTDLIGAHILNISKQDYDPQGASVTILISEEPLNETLLDETCNKGNISFIEKETVCAHLDKSHITVHTYPEYHPNKSISSFRVDIDVSTCGKISPLKTLNYLIQCFDSDIISIDYRVRGFTRTVDGKKCFLDHKITSIQDYISEEIQERYDAHDVNIYGSNIFHTMMIIKELNLSNYLFGKDVNEFTPKERLKISNDLRQEMIEIYSGSNIYDNE